MALFYYILSRNRLRRGPDEHVRGPPADRDEALLRTLLDTSACLWNQLNYERFQNLNECESVRDTADYRKRFIGTLSSATAQQVIRTYSEAWRTFFAAQEAGESAAPPGFWGNRGAGRELRTSIRIDQYTLGTGEQSRLEIPGAKI